MTNEISCISSLRAFFIEHEGVMTTSCKEKLVASYATSQEEIDVLLAKMIQDLHPKNMVLIDLITMGRRQMLMKIIDSKEDEPLYQSIKEEYLFLRNIYRKAFLDTEKCREVLEIILQKVNSSVDGDAKLMAALREFASFCETYYLDTTLFKRLRVNIKYAPIILEADDKVKLAKGSFSNEIYRQIAEQLYLAHASLFKGEFFYYGIILGMLNAVCKSYHLPIPDYTTFELVETDDQEPVVPENQLECEEEVVAEAPGMREVVTKNDAVVPEEVLTIPEEEVRLETGENEMVTGTENVEHEAPEVEGVVPEAGEDLGAVTSGEETIDEKQTVEESVPEEQEVKHEENATESGEEIIVENENIPDQPEVERKQDEEIDKPEDTVTIDVLQEEIEKIPEEVLQTDEAGEEKEETLGESVNMNGGDDGSKTSKGKSVIWVIVVIVIGLLGTMAYFFLSGDEPEMVSEKAEVAMESLPSYYAKIEMNDAELLSKAIEVAGEEKLMDKKFVSPCLIGKTLEAGMRFVLNKSDESAVGVIVYNGAIRKDSEWREFGRAKSIILSVNGESYALFKLEDTKQAQVFDIEIAAGSEVEFKVKEFYAGQPDKEIAISGIRFVGTTVKQTIPPVLKEPVKVEKKAALPEAKEVVRVPKKTEQEVENAGTTKKTDGQQAKTESVEQKLSKAKNSYMRGDYSEALKLFKPIANGGNAEAQYYMGIMYERGQGVKADQFEALVWYRRAASAKYVAASERLKELGY